MKGRLRTEMKSIVLSVIKVSQNYFDGLLVGQPRKMHILTHPIDSEGDIRSCKDKILKTTHCTMIKMRILK